MTYVMDESSVAEDAWRTGLKMVDHKMMNAITIPVSLTLDFARCRVLSITSDRSVL